MFILIIRNTLLYIYRRTFFYKNVEDEIDPDVLNMGYERT